MKIALTSTKAVDTVYEKSCHYRGEFDGVVRPFDRYLDDNRFKEIEMERKEKFGDKK